MLWDFVLYSWITFCHNNNCMELSQLKFLHIFKCIEKTGLLQICNRFTFWAAIVISHNIFHFINDMFEKCTPVVSTHTNLTLRQKVIFRYYVQAGLRDPLTT